MCGQGALVVGRWIYVRPPPAGVATAGERERPGFPPRGRASRGVLPAVRGSGRCLAERARRAKAGAALSAARLQPAWVVDHGSKAGARGTGPQPGATFPQRRRTLGWKTLEWGPALSRRAWAVHSQARARRSRNGITPGSSVPPAAARPAPRSTPVRP